MSDLDEAQRQKIIRELDYQLSRWGADDPKWVRANILLGIVLDILNSSTEDVGPDLLDHSFGHDVFDDASVRDGLDELLSSSGANTSEEAARLIIKYYEVRPRVLVAEQDARS